MVTWDFDAMEKRVIENQYMREEDIRSRKIEVYQRTLDERKVKGGVKKGGGGAGTGKKKKNKK